MGSLRDRRSPPRVKIAPGLTAEDVVDIAAAKTCAGTSLVQLYTAVVNGGPALVGRIKAELAALLRRDGFESVGAAVGADSR